MGLEKILHTALLQAQISLAVAESCTGGLFMATLTKYSGSTDYFLGGVVCYSNESKIRDLDVDKVIIGEYGAVSEACAQAMALGIRKRFNSQYGLSITGIAGPTGGTSEKPVGKVYVGISKSGESLVQSYQFSGNRNTIRKKATQEAAALLLKMIRDEN